MSVLSGSTEFNQKRNLKLLNIYKYTAMKSFQATVKVI